jgi:branched-chain amino acid transport system substrate-binding protein
MRLALAATLAASVLCAAGGALAQEVHVGVVTSLSEQMALLGEQLRDGARTAAEEAGVRITVADDQCTAEGGAAAARQLLAADVDIVAGFLCTEAIEAALPILTEAGIPVITPAVRSDGLTDRRARTGWLVWRLAPRADAERAAVADILSRRWRDALFAIVDDGTIYGRELAETLRLAAETAALRPVFVDTYRPQSENQIGLVGRLARAGASHAFVGGDRDDVAIMGRDAIELDHDIVFAGGEALRAAGEVPIAAGTLMVALPEWGDMIDEGTVGSFTARDIVPDGYVLPAHAAVEVAIDAVSRSADQAVALPAILDGTSFETVIGPVAFDGKGDLTVNPFRLFRHDGERFLPAE